MKFTRIAGTVAVILLFGTMIPVYAQRDGQGGKQGDRQDKPARAQGKRRKSTPSRQKSAPQAKQQQRQQGQPAQQRQKAQQPERAQQRQQQRSPQARHPAQPQRTREQAQAWQKQRGWLQKGGWQGHNSWQQNRAQHWVSDHRTWAQRGGYGGYYVPQTSFSLYFGSQHFFRIRTRPVIYMGYPRFQYRGYSFLMLDPWPEYWSEDWYANDDVYVDYDDGYYLYNRRYPGVSLAITLVL